MKGLLTSAILAMAALLLGVTVVLECRQPPASMDVLTGQSIHFAKSYLPMDLGTPPTPPPLLQFQPDRPAFPPAHLPNPDSDVIPFEPGLPLLAERSRQQSLPPGVYQTYPWTLIVVVPGAVTENGDFIVKPNTNSPMPIVNPHVEMVPKS